MASKPQQPTSKWLNRRCPQNYIIKNPGLGSLILAVLVIAFLIIYKPLGVHASYLLSFELTVIVYAVTVAVPVALGAKLLKSTRYFSNAKDWTIKKELLAIGTILLLMGTIVYFAAFIIEEPSNRWNFKTLLDSYLRTTLGAGIPFLLFSLINLPYWYLPERLLVEETHDKPTEYDPSSNEHVNIESKLNKEKLSFTINEFIYAVSEGNYVNFHLIQQGQIRKAVIRNSINDIEQQLAKFPRIIRVHRAYIVNVDKVRTMKGNSLGYLLKLVGITEEIPVSRKNTVTFRTLFKA
ncbi:LytR/AlgR family response regulator transcription factor [Perlabentimonas gracilis]|uniref:LytR/AlgR family response regulator transcription factor n=1 Tax=Perlabentimonas gracilis TaxID=2715279 RepID=UPI00140CB2E8|nr:LytTR family DNA-binding domain-containing protein [Perlabentimonas gracilis]NHB68049.1 LytTR family transcriptional regulator [Perlabentimonas gracilis]